MKVEYEELVHAVIYMDTNSWASWCGIEEIVEIGDFDLPRYKDVNCPGCKDEMELKD